MIIMKEPYFLKNEAWYYYDKNRGKYILTDIAPLKAIESYKEYYKTLDDVKKEFKFDETTEK